MNIRINVSSILLQHTNGQQVIEVNGSTVGQCLEHLVEQFPGIEQGLFDKNGKLHHFINIYVNEESAYPEELAKLVKEGDELHIVFLLGGG